MAPFYAMSIEPDLFGGSALVHRWGRIGTRGQERIDLPKDDFQAISHFLFFARQKRGQAWCPDPLSTGAEPGGGLLFRWQAARRSGM